MDGLPEVGRSLVPVGGGGQIVGIALVYSLLKLQRLITGILTGACPSALLSLRYGKVLDPYDHEPALVDGLAEGFGKIQFRVASMLVNDKLLASEDENQ